MELAIKVEALSKAYQLGEIGTGTLSRDIERWIAKLRGKEDPFIKVGQSIRTLNNNNNTVWSLKDVSFEIKRGDAVGIIGRNGAGKSTLLKLLSRVTSPTRGEISVKGRIASLLEVGTGFHADLTGRDNIFLNGAILGMRKKEIQHKFDEIVDFAGVERYIDTPVKRYSSGMYVRLAFAVAAHLESEILIVDEVLAVGDAEFQKKCLGKMSEVSEGEGRTVLFVSHNIASIKHLCNKGIVLENGALRVSGCINSAISYYKQESNSNNEKTLLDLISSQHPDIIVNDISINDERRQKISLDSTSGALNISINGSTRDKMEVNIEVRLYNSENTLVAFYSPAHTNGEVKIIKGNFYFSDSVAVPDNLASGTYSLDIQLSKANIETFVNFKGVRLIKGYGDTIAGRPAEFNHTGFFWMKRNIIFNTISLP